MAEGPWEKLSQVAVLGAEYDSPERQPHPKCLKGTRVDLLNHIYRLLDNRQKNNLIWLHGTAGVGKSAVAFTVAERMRGLKVREETNVEKKSGSREHSFFRASTRNAARLVISLQLLLTSLPSIFPASGRT